MKQVSKRVNFVRVCGATLLAAFAATAFGHDDDQNRTDKPLVWVDSKGKTIGRAVGEHGVQIKIDGLVLIVPVGNSVVCPGTPDTCKINLDVTWGGDFSIVLFTDKNCGGDAYIGTPTQPGSARAVTVVGNTLYIGVNSSYSLVPISSQRSPLNGCFNFGNSFPLLATKAKTPTRDVRTLGFKPPFYLK